MFESLAASPVTALGLWAMGAAFVWLAFRIGWVEGRDAARRDAPRLTLVHVVREVAVDSEEASNAAAEKFRDFEVRH